jgi:RNA polymerase sigma factor (TIGR02999 family)
MPASGEATQILTAIGRGDHSAAERLLPLVYDELRALATDYMQRERPGHTLDPTALVHEAYLRMIDQKQASWNDRTHFIAVAAEVIRRVLVDHARKHKALKRGGDRERSEAGDVANPAAADGVDLLALDEALDDLGELNERLRRVVELLYFGGLTAEDAAGLLEVTPRTIRSDWRTARAWLRQRLDE